MDGSVSVDSLKEFAPWPTCWLQLISLQRNAGTEQFDAGDRFRFWSWRVRFDTAGAFIDNGAIMKNWIW